MTKQTESIQWVGDTSGHLDLLDQTLLPTTLERIECQTVETVWEAIKMLRVRGAPAIGIAAAYGVVVGLQTVDDENQDAFFERFDHVLTYLAESRPTAVNLFWALDRMRRCGQQQKESGSSLQETRTALFSRSDCDSRTRSSNVPRDWKAWASACSTAYPAC